MQTERRSNGSISTRIDPSKLSFGEMTVDDSTGGVMTKEQKIQTRSKLGYCTTCPQLPILLFDVKRSRLSPVWNTKKPRTVQGECMDGKCLKCNRQDMDSRSGHSLAHSGSSHSSSDNSSASQTELSFSNAPNRRTPPSRSVSDNQAFSRLPASGNATLQMIRNNSRMSLSRVPSWRSLNRASSVRSSTDNQSGQTTTSTTMPETTTNVNLATQSSALLRESHRGSPAHAGRYDESDQTTTDPVNRPSRRNLPARVRSERIATPRYNSASLRSLPSRSMSRNNSSSLEISSMASTAGPAEQTGTNEASRATVKSTTTVEDGMSLSQLKPLIQELVSQGDFALLADTICNAMKSSHSQEKVQVLCLHVLSSQKKKKKSFFGAMVASDVQQGILRAMMTFELSLHVNTKGCAALAAMCVDEASRQILLRDGACQVLHKAMIKHIGDECVITSAIGALRILSVETEARELLLAQSTSCQTVQAMVCHASVEDIQRDGCALLSNLALDVAKKQVSAVDKSTIEVVVSALSNHKGNASVAKSACFALKNFTYEQSNLRCLARLPTAFDGLGNAIEECADAEWILEKIQVSMAEDESMEEQAQESLKVLLQFKVDTTTTMVDVMNMLEVYAWSPTIIASCLKVLAEVAAESDAIKTELCEEATLAKLFKYIQDFSEDGRVQLEARSLADVLITEDIESTCSERCQMLLASFGADKGVPDLARSVSNTPVE